MLFLTQRRVTQAWEPTKFTCWILPFEIASLTTLLTDTETTDSHCVILGTVNYRLCQVEWFGRTPVNELWVLVSVSGSVNAPLVCDNQTHRSWRKECRRTVRIATSTWDASTSWQDWETGAFPRSSASAACGRSVTSLAPPRCPPTLETSRRFSELK